MNVREEFRSTLGISRARATVRGFLATAFLLGRVNRDPVRREVYRARTVRVNLSSVNNQQGGIIRHVAAIKANTPLNRVSFNVQVAAIPRHLLRPVSIVAREVSVASNVLTAANLKIRYVIDKVEVNKSRVRQGFFFLARTRRIFGPRTFPLLNVGRVLQVRRKLILIMSLAIRANINRRITNNETACSRNFVCALSDLNNVLMRLRVITLNSVRRANYKIHVRVELIPRLGVPNTRFIRAMTTRRVPNRVTGRVTPFARLYAIRNSIITMPRLNFTIKDDRGEKGRDRFRGELRARERRTIVGVVRVLPVVRRTTIFLPRACRRIVIRRIIRASVARATFLFHRLRVFRPANAGSFIHAANARARAPVVLRQFNFNLYQGVGVLYLRHRYRRQHYARSPGLAFRLSCLCYLYLGLSGAEKRRPIFAIRRRHLPYLLNTKQDQRQDRLNDRAQYRCQDVTAVL